MTDDRLLASRRTLEIAVAAALFGLGAIMTYGAIEFHVGWDESGPQPGYVPFYLGLIVMAASVGAGVQAWLRAEWRAVPFVTRSQAWRVGTFFGPVVVFVILCNLVGLYVAMALYLVFTTRFQGCYGWPRALAIGIGTALAFFVLFEFLFGQPLLKGPLEALLGYE